MIKNNSNSLNWSSNDIIYQIYPLSFYDTNGNGKGDLKGIISKLDYLNDGTEKSLGVNAIWLGPIYKSPMRDFGYDISDYYKVDPIFGNMKNFDKLVAEAHKRNIKIVMDFVPNHTSDQHAWFKQSRFSLKNPKRDWYVWQNPKPDGSPPNNWLSRFGGSVWTFDKKTGQYYLHSFLECQPDLNWRNPQVKKAMGKILKFWLDRGVDGFRLDAFYHIIKDAKFRDNPVNLSYIVGYDDPYRQFLNVYDRGRPEILEILNWFCNIVGSYPNKFMVSEAFFNTRVSEMKVYYKQCKITKHAPFNFHFVSLPWNSWIYKNFIENYEENLSEGDWPNYVLGNHDRSRVVSRVGEKKARLLAMMIFTLRGMAFIYYGEEIGMRDLKMRENKMLDPFTQLVPGFSLGRDPQRTPMQWDLSKNAGFSKGKPWLPVPINYLKYNVKSEAKDENSMLNLYCQLIHFRRKSEAVLKGKYYTLNIRPKSIFSYIRESEAEKILVLLNFTEKKQLLKLPFKRAEIVCNTFLNRKKGQIIDLKKFSLKPLEGCILRIFK